MRCSAAAAYLHPAMGRPNLKVITDALAPGSCSTASGRSASRSRVDGRLEEVRADKEVILSAGAYNSPQLLMLSGIGPAADFAMLQIEPRKDLPVGDRAAGPSDDAHDLVHRHRDPDDRARPPRISRCCRAKAAAR